MSARLAASDYNKYTMEKDGNMTEILAVFRSRTQAAACNDLLRRTGVPAALVPTPAELKAGCGLSVSFPAGMLRAVKRAAAREGMPVYCYAGYNGARRAYIKIT